MRLKVQVIIESESGETEAVQEVTTLERHTLRPESLGLTLSEAKALLQEVQHAMVTHQSAEYVTQHLACPDCGRIRSGAAEGLAGSAGRGSGRVRVAVAIGVSLKG